MDIKTAPSAPFFYGTRQSPSSFEPQRCWLPVLTPVTYLSKTLRIPPLAAWLQFEIRWGLSVVQ